MSENKRGKMKYQLIVSTMNQVDHSLCEKMKINSDAIVINQCDRFEKDSFEYRGNRIDFYSFDERGVGLSRNSGLMRSEADIIQFADDDMIFTDTYKDDVIKEYEKHPEADVILFSINSLNEDRPVYYIDKFSRINRIEAVEFGGARISARRNRILYNNVYYSLLFGGGAKYGAGEDTTFIQDCLKAGLRVYKSPIKIADVKQDGSTWFTGYNEKFYKDKGALLEANFPMISEFGVIYESIKHKKDGVFSSRELYKIYRSGLKEYRKNRKYR